MLRFVFAPAATYKNPNKGFFFSSLEINRKPWRCRSAQCVFSPTTPLSPSRACLLVAIPSVIPALCLSPCAPLFPSRPHGALSAPRSSLFPLSLKTSIFFASPRLQNLTLSLTLVLRTPEFPLNSSLSHSLNPSSPNGALLCSHEAQSPTQSVRFRRS